MEIKYKRCLDAWLCDMHGEGFAYEADSHEADSHEAVRESRPGAILRIRSVAISSDRYHSEVGSSIPGYGK